MTVIVFIDIKHAIHFFSVKFNETIISEQINAFFYFYWCFLLIFSIRLKWDDKNVPYLVEIINALLDSSLSHSPLNIIKFSLKLLFQSIIYEKIHKCIQRPPYLWDIDFGCPVKKKSHEKYSRYRSIIVCKSSLYDKVTLHARIY